MTIETLDGDAATDVLATVVGLDPYQSFHAYLDEQGFDLGDYTVYSIEADGTQRHVIQQRIVDSDAEKRGFIELSICSGDVHRAEGLLEHYAPDSSLAEEVRLSISDSGGVRTDRQSFRCRRT